MLSIGVDSHVYLCRAPNWLLMTSDDRRDSQASGVMNMKEGKHDENLNPPPVFLPPSVGQS